MGDQSDKNYHKIQCRVSEYEWKRFKELEAKGITVRQALETLCDKCNGIKVIAFHKENGNPIEIPNNILSKRK